MSNLEKFADSTQSKILCHEVIIQAIMVNIDQETRDKITDLVEQNMNAFLKAADDGTPRKKEKIEQAMIDAGNILGRTLEVK